MNADGDFDRVLEEFFRESRVLFDHFGEVIQTYIIKRVVGPDEMRRVGEKKRAFVDIVSCLSNRSF